MTGAIYLRRAAWAALVLLAACGGGPRGDWRAEIRRPTPNPVVLTPGLPLAIPSTLELPPPGAGNRARPQG